jgi:hypothetical protein
MVGRLSLSLGRLVVAIHKTKHALDQRCRVEMIGIMTRVAEFVHSDAVQADCFYTIPEKVSVCFFVCRHTVRVHAFSPTSDLSEPRQKGRRGINFAWQAMRNTVIVAAKG